MASLPLSAPYIVGLVVAGYCKSNLNMLHREVRQKKTLYLNKLKKYIFPFAVYRKNGTYNERMAALLEDSVAFGIGGFTICFVEFVLQVFAVTCVNYAATNQVNVLVYF